MAAACATSPGDVPALRNVPWTEKEVDRLVADARLDIDGGRPLEALRRLDGVLASNPDHVDAHRLRQDVLRARGRMPLLLAEARSRVAADPVNAEWRYLLGRLQQGETQRATFEKCVALAPDSYWGWHGLAFSLRGVDTELAIDLYRQLHERSGQHPLAAVGYGAALRSAGDLERAAQVYDELRGDQRLPGVGDLGLAQTYSQAADPRRSWAPLLQALKSRPADPQVLRLVQELEARGLGLDRREQLLDILREDPARAAEFTRGGGAAVLADVHLRAGRPQAARAVLRGDGSGPRRPEARRMWRRLLLSLGDVNGFFAALERDLPRFLLADEQNQVRGLWLELLRGPWRDGVDPEGRPSATVRMVRALRDTGLLEEAEAAAQAFVDRLEGRPQEELAVLLVEVQKELAFEGACRRVLYQGYSADEPRSLEEVLATFRALSVEILGRDVVGNPERFSAPFVGEQIDAFSPGLGRHLASYNRHLVLGQRSGSPPEGLLLTRLSVRDVPSVPDLEVPTRCFEVVGEDRQLRPIGALGRGDLAGVALLDHYVVDMDEVRKWAQALERQRAVAAQDENGLLDDPLPDDLGPLDNLDGDWRLAVAAEFSVDIEEAVFDMIRWHELGHLVDFFHFLPAESKLGRAIGLVLGNGLSAHGVESEMEGRAETAALALSPYTRLVLAHVADFLDADSELSPHARGFRALATRLQAKLVERGLTADAVRAAAWHRLDPALVREAALEILREHY